ncbi:hypothetical protein GE061_019272 [Apolygus lucorum]|uniref:Small RNA 2'-O-methyltransferase n=1 Tax=Apolygus lucorum TaxID=248454 RepID=A0A8S9XC32_APOLU|nr:hypothetical protein GE061_019272 [Apolygus lucorum]
MSPTNLSPPAFLRTSEGDDVGSEGVETLEEARKLIRELRERHRIQSHQLLSWRRRLKAQEEHIARVNVERNEQLRKLSMQLLLFESRLCRKQRDISALLTHRENIIAKQQKIIRQMQRRLSDAGVETLTDDAATLDSLNDSDSAVILEDDDSSTPSLTFQHNGAVTVIRSVSDALETPNSNKYSMLRRSQCLLRRPEILETVYSVEEDPDADGNVTPTPQEEPSDRNHPGTGRPPRLKELSGSFERLDHSEGVTLSACDLTHDPAETTHDPLQAPPTTQVTTYNRVMSNHRQIKVARGAAGATQKLGGERKQNRRFPRPDFQLNHLSDDPRWINSAASQNIDVANLTSVRKTVVFGSGLKMIASVLVLLDYSFSLLRKSVFGRYLLGRCSSPLHCSPFRFELPVLDANCVDDPESGIRFWPPVYTQRYSLTARIFEQKKLLGGCKKIVDFGCAEIALFNYVKQAEGVEEYIAVDIDQELLNRYSCRVLPLTFDYLSDRTHPFNVKVLCGSVAEPDSRLFGTDVVVAIELIEHLYPEPLEDLPFNIFGLIQPDVAVFTTPNSDFNVLFRDLIGFRHDDHKFEWSREQFKDWADNLVVRYPNYEVEVSGIGPGPPGSEHLGCCTQIAIFFRKGPRNHIDDVYCKETYKLIRNVDYPFTDPQVLFEGSVKYYAESYIRLSINSEKYLHDDDEHRIPFCDVEDHVIGKVPTCTRDQVKQLFKNDWKIVKEETGELTVVVPYDGQEDAWSISSQATSTDRSLVTDLEDYRLNACAAEDSDWDAEPDNESLTLHLNDTEMNEDGFPPYAPQDEEPDVADHQFPMMAPLVPEGCPLKAPEVEASSGPVINNINRGDPNGVLALPKCHSLEQINPSKNKSFRFSLNMEKSDPFSCDISSANSESNRDKSVPSFSESFGLRLEDSCSQSKAADSGYPNSFGQDMDMDLTPEQVDEIITETESSFDGDDESISGDEMDEPGQHQLLNREMGNAPPLLRFLDNVENGDVANNNRDGEGNNMEDNNRDIGEVLEFVQDVIQAEEAFQHLNMAEGRAPQYPDESDEEAISNTVDGSSQADSTLPMLDDDTIQRCLADRGIAVVMGDAPTVSASPSLPITPSNTRNPSIDDLASSSMNEFPSWLCNILLDDEDDGLGGGDTDTLDGLRGDGVTTDEDIVRLDLDYEPSTDYLIPGDVQGGGEPSTR